MWSSWEAKKTTATANYEMSKFKARRTRQPVEYRVIKVIQGWKWAMPEFIWLVVLGLAVLERLLFFRPLWFHTLQFNFVSFILSGRAESAKAGWTISLAPYVHHVASSWFSIMCFQRVQPASQPFVEVAVNSFLSTRPSCTRSTLYFCLFSVR